MSSRRAPALPLTLLALTLTLALALAPPQALADGEDAAREYDPLNLSLHAFLTTEGRITREAPPAGSIAFGAGDASSPPPPLEWSMSTPVRFVPASGLTVSLLLESGSPLLAQDRDGKSFELTLLSDGKPVEGASARVAASPLLTPGRTERLNMTLQAPGSTFDEGATLTLHVQPLMSVVPADTLRLLVGAEGSRADFERMRVPSVADLGLNDGLLEYHLEEETYAPADANVTPYAVRVLHDAVPFGSVSQPVGARVALVFQGVEADEETQRSHAALDRDARRAAAHTFRVGDQLVRVHPGVGVVVPLSSDTEAAILVECVANCPAAGFTSTVNFRTAQEMERISPPQDGGLIPPPPDTTGIPVSKDAPSGDRAVPGAGAAGVATALTAAAALAAASTRQRR